MLSPFVYRKHRSTITLHSGRLFSFRSASASMAMAQESYLVTAADGSLSAYNLATNNLIETTTAGLGKGHVTVGPNPAIGVYLGRQLYLGDRSRDPARDIARFQYYVGSGPLVFTPDGQISADLRLQ